MINKYVLLILFLLLASPMSNAMANFGLGPCCSGWLCGIIPCDSACAGSAITSMGSSVSSALNNLDSAYQDISSEYQDAMDSMNELGTDVNNALANKNRDLLVGLSASTNRIELASSMEYKTLERNTDYIVMSFVNTLKESSISKNISENARMFGDASQPISGELGVQQAAAIKSFHAQWKQISAASTQGFMQYVGDESNTIAGGNKGLHTMQSIKKLDEFSELYRIHTDRTLSDSDFGGMQTLVGLVTSKYPLVKTSTAGGEYELLRKRHIAMLSIVYNGLLSSAYSKVGIDDANWANFYQSVTKNADGNISLSEFYQVEVNGRVSDPEWWGSTLRLNDVGLEREKVYQYSLSLHLKDRLGEVSTTSNILMGILLAEKTRSQQLGLNSL